MPSQNGSRLGGPNASMAAPQANASIAALSSGINSNIPPVAATSDNGPDENSDDANIDDLLYS